MKRCPRCKKTLPDSAFGKRKWNGDGLDSYCKECRNEYAINYYHKRKKQRPKGKEAYKVGW